MAESQAKQSEAKRWIDQVERAERDPRYVAWLKRCRIINRRYREERFLNSVEPVINNRRYAILWANEQTLAPALYAREPNTVVTRRFKDEDPVARMASEVLERCVSYSNEEGRLDDLMKLAVKDYLLVGRGVGWCRYVPTYGPFRVPVQITDDVYTDPTGEKYEAEQVLRDEQGPHIMDKQVVNEEVCEDHVSYDDFVHAPVREWNENPWVARKVAMTREELEQRKFKDWEKVPLDWKPITDNDDPEDGIAPPTKKAVIYELWHKPTAKVIWFSKSYQYILDERDDPLGLEEFFPCGMPLVATTDLNSIVPIPDFVFYQDQAEELDELTARIGKLTDALRMNGFYSGEHNQAVDRVFSAGNENKLIPVESWAAFKEGGGAKGIIEWVPIDMVAETLRACFETRRQIIDDIYQITGISDIMRGETDPNETATAQGLKANYGSLRVRDRQKSVAQFGRDIIRIKGEIIASKFSLPTLKAMSNVKMFDSPEEKVQVQQQMQAQAQMAQQAGQQPPPVPQDVQQMMDRPTWQEVMGLLQDKPMRQFRIEVETDSTIEPNETEQKQARVEFITAVGQYLGNILPVVQASPQMVPVAMEGLKWLVRGFRVGREMEEVIDRASDQIMQAAANPQQTPPDPAEAAKAQSEMMKNALEQQRLQFEQQQAQVQAQMDQRDQMLEQQKTEMDAAIESQKLELERLKLQLEDKHRTEDREVQADQAERDRQAQQVREVGE